MHIVTIGMNLANTAIGDLLGEVTPGGKQRLGRVTMAWWTRTCTAWLVTGVRAVLALALNRNHPRQHSLSHWASTITQVWPMRSAAEHSRRGTGFQCLRGRTPQWASGCCIG